MVSSGRGNAQLEASAQKEAFMAKQSGLSRELKGLGQDLAKAMAQMKSSREFKDLEAAVIHAIKTVSQSLTKSVHAARKSPTTRNLGTRIGRVFEEGKKTGKAEVQRAKNLAAQNIRKARKKLRKLTP